MLARNMSSLRFSLEINSLIFFLKLILNLLDASWHIKGILYKYTRGGLFPDSGNSAKEQQNVLELFQFSVFHSSVLDIIMQALFLDVFLQRPPTQSWRKREFLEKFREIPLAFFVKYLVFFCEFLEFIKK